MQAQETNAVCAVAKDTPREGSRWVEAAIDSGAEESAAHRMCSQVKSMPAPCSKWLANFKAADETQIPNFGQ